MSDYIFLLESHLSSEQNQVVAEVQAAARQAGVSVFLTGGAMRDMLGGFQIRDLDFTVEGNALKVAKAVAHRTGARIVEQDELRRSAELEFPSGATAQIAMARTETYRKAGAKPQIEPATIQEDLRRRDFGVNAIALSLSQASLGLLLDPTNGQADLGRRELRTLHSMSFYDDPVRLLRLIRYRIRLDFAVEERTASQWRNAREAKMENSIAPRSLFAELSRIAGEPSPCVVIAALEEAGLLGLFAPGLAGPKANPGGLAKLDKCAKMLPPSVSRKEHFGPFLYALTEKLSPREKAGLIKNTAMQKAETERWQKIDARSKKLEKAARAPGLRKPSQVYSLLKSAPGEEILFLLYHSASKPVQDRLRNHLQKYIDLAQDITDADVAAAGVRPDNPKFAKVKEAMMNARLDGKTRKPEPATIIALPEPAGRGRVPNPA
jgi:tRNA nucleotidyltransferase/poly(A) polymerase